MRLGIDLDGVVAHFTAGYADLIREVSGRDLLTPEMIADPPSWNWDRDAGYTKEEETATWDAIKADAGFWRRLPPLPGAEHALGQLFQLRCKGHEVYFITHRMGEWVKWQSECWLEEHGFPYHATVLVAGDKVPIIKALELDVFIDDKPSTLRALMAMDVPPRFYKVAYRYNAEAPGIPVSGVSEMLAQEGLL